MALDKIFYPDTIAVIGASDKKNSIGYSLFSNLRQQKIYPVNPNISKIDGVRCYPKVGDIPVEIDLAIVAVPAKIVPIVVDQAAVKGIKNIIIISSGFKESGQVDLENLVALICRKNNINLVGPNCLGVLNPKTGLNASFAPFLPRSGPIAFISQSGAICSAVIDTATRYSLGYSKIVSLGNKTILDENEILSYLATDETTSVVAIYTEQLSAPSTLFNYPKPVIVLKSGTTTEGQAAAKSHTGALAGRDAAYDALFKQTGTIRANTLAEFFDYQTAFINNPLPVGNRLAIVTNAGGIGVIAADAASKQNLKVTAVTDLLGDATADTYRQALLSVDADSVLVILTPQSVTEVEQTADVIINFKKTSRLPIIACFIGDISVNQAVTKLRQHGVCVVDYPEAGIKSIAALVNYVSFKQQSIPQYFPYFDNINFSPDYYLATTVEDAVNYSQTQKVPLALKISSPDILHKSDVGGVVLNVDPTYVAAEFTKLIEHINTTLPTAVINGVLIEPMSDRSRGVELILGSFNDPSLGQTIMIGAGGIYTEILNDTAFGIVPITKTNALDMLNRLKVKTILDGTRGQQPYDIDAVIDCLGQLSQYLSEHPNTKEIDINPLLVMPQGEGVKILDFRIIN